MGRVYLELENLDSMVAFVKDLQKKTGLLKDISTDKVEKILKNSNKVIFPVKIPIELEDVISLVSQNPIATKMFGKKIDDAAKKFLIAMLNNI